MPLPLAGHIMLGSDNTLVYPRAARRFGPPRLGERPSGAGRPSFRTWRSWRCSHPSRELRGQGNLGHRPKLGALWVLGRGRWPPRRCPRSFGRPFPNPKTHPRAPPIRPLHTSRGPRWYGDGLVEVIWDRAHPDHARSGSLVIGALVYSLWGVDTCSPGLVWSIVPLVRSPRLLLSSPSQSVGLGG